MHLDATTIIVALISAAAATVGVLVSRRGQAKSEKLDEQRNEVDRMAKTYDALQGMLDAAIAQHGHCEELRVADAERHDRQLAACQAHADSLTSALATLQSIVTDEIAEAAVEQYGDDDSPEAREHIKEFMRTMRQIGGNT